MNSKVSRENLRQLMAYEGDWAVSIFMSTHRAGVETRQDPIRFKNLLRMAEHAMANRGIVNGSRRKCLDQAYGLIPNNDFWQHQNDGLAMFIGPSHFSYFTVPFHFAENAVVDRRFHVKPLLPVYYGDERFYLLSLSQKRVKVFLCSRDEAQEIQVVGVPRGIEDYLQFIDQSTAHQSRSTTIRTSGAATVFGSHGPGDENDKQRVREFFQQIDSGLHDLLRDESVPLVIACVDYLFPLYNEVNTYAHLHPQHLGGNPEANGPRELQARAWALLEPVFTRKQTEALKTYQRLEGTRKTSRQLRSLIPAAVNGRVETLLVAADQELWGVVDPEDGSVKETRHQPPAEAVELVNLAAVHTLLNGGNVYTMPSDVMPHGAPMTAIYRY